MLDAVTFAAGCATGVAAFSTLTGSAFGAGKSAVNYTTNKVGDKIAESTAPMNDDDYLDSNSKKYSPVSVVEDANKALSTGNASRETIKESKARIDNAKKSVNKEIQELERIVFNSVSTVLAVRLILVACSSGFSKLMLGATKLCCIMMAE